MEQEKKNLNFKIIIPIVAAVIVAIVGIILLVTNKGIWEYIDKGEFEQAYEQAKNEEEKSSVIKANAIAYVTALTMNNSDIYTSTSYIFVIKDAWYDNDKNIVLYIRDGIKEKEFYLYYGYNENKKDYDFVCKSDHPITIENITLADSYTIGIKNSGYSTAVQNYAITILKQKLPDKLARIMTNENRITREVNISNYLLSGYVQLKNNITLLNVES